MSNFFSVSLLLNVKKNKQLIETIDMVADGVSRNRPSNAYIIEKSHLIIHTANIYLAHIMCQVVCLDYRGEKKRTKP